HHDLLMKPNIHRGRVTRITAVMKFLCEFLARSKTAVKGKELHEIDDGVLPIELLRSFIVQGVEHSGDVDRWSGGRRCRSRRGGRGGACCRAGLSRRRGLDSRSGGSGRPAQYL